MARFEFEFDPPLRQVVWFEAQRLTLPDTHAPLWEQRATAKAIKLLFPEATLKVYSCTDMPNGTIIRRTVKI